MSQLRPPKLVFEPLVTVPKVHAHLSAFSWPRVSYQAFRSGSEVVSSNSCERMEAIESAAKLPLGPLPLTAEQLAGHCVVGSPMNEYLMSRPLMVACVCQPQ